jgi:hypothetical protein
MNPIGVSELEPECYAEDPSGGEFLIGGFFADYDTSQGSEVKEKEKARHLKDGAHST